MNPRDVSALGTTFQDQLALIFDPLFKLYMFFTQVMKLLTSLQLLTSLRESVRSRVISDPKGSNVMKMKSCIINKYMIHRNTIVCNFSQSDPHLYTSNKY